MPKEPLYPHVPKSRKPEPPPRQCLEELGAVLVGKMSEEMGTRDEYYKIATAADLAGRPDIARELRKIGDVEHGHYLKLDELERKLRSGG